MPRRALVFSLAVALVAGSSAAVDAATSGTASSPGARPATAKDARVQELHDLIGEVSEQEGALLREMAEIRERLSELNATVRRFDREVAVARRRLRAAERELARAEARRLELARRLAEAQARVEAARQAMNVTITALYQRGQSEQQAMYATVLEMSGSPHEAFTAVHYIAETVREQRADLDRFTVLKAEAQRLSREAEAQAAVAKAARDVLDADRARIEGLRAEAIAARAAARAEEDREEELLDEVQSRKSEFLRELRLLQVESSAIGEMLRAAQAGQRLAPRRKGTFRLPVNAPMSSRFGPRVHPVYGDTRVHTGVDFAAGAGTPIRAGGPGRVLWAGPRGGYGNLVVLDHGNGLATLYAHQSSVEVTVGQRVETGAVVGRVGSTGLSTGPHLHFETRELGTPADPLWYL